jgi:hypothetical protein
MAYISWIIYQMKRHPSLVIVTLIMFTTDRFILRPFIKEDLDNMRCL